MQWNPGITAPQDGRRIWAWLYDGGIHLMQWRKAEDCPDIMADCWVKACDPEDGDWNVKFWLPEAAIATPDGVAFIHDLNRWRDVAPQLTK